MSSHGTRSPLLALLALLAGLALAPIAHAAHPLFLQILVVDTGSPHHDGVPREREVALGIPIARASAIMDASRVMVVGADWNEARGLSWWPEGTLRWVLLTFPVTIKPGERSTAWYVATGSGRKSRPAGAPRASGDGLVAQVMPPLAYDHAEVFARALRAGAPPPDARALAAMTLEELLLEHLGCTDQPACAVLRSEARERVVAILRAGSMDASDAYGLALWYLLTGEIDAWHRARLWGRRAVSRDDESAGHEHRPLALLELYAFTRDSRFLSCARDGAPGRAETVLQSFLRPPPPAAPVTTPMPASGTSFSFEPARAGSAANSGPRAATTASFDVSFTPDPDPIPRNRLFSLMVAVKPRDAAVAPSLVLVDADMPAHRHGMPTAPVVHALGDGRFRVDGMLFHMPGAWEITIDLVVAASVERAVFPWTLE